MHVSYLTLDSSWNLRNVQSYRLTLYKPYHKSYSESYNGSYFQSIYKPYRKSIIVSYTKSYSNP